MCAAAGSVILYDSKTWHRAASERNVSGSDRIAILNAVTPRFVVPMIDMVRGALSDWPNVWRCSGSYEHNGISETRWFGARRRRSLRTWSKQAMGKDGRAN